MTANEKLKELRKKENLTLKDVAVRIGVSEATVHRYETGKIKVIPYDAILALAKLYDVPPASIMGWELTPDDLKIMEKLTSTDLKMINAFRAAPIGIQESVLILLGLRERA